MKHEYSIFTFPQNCYCIKGKCFTYCMYFISAKPPLILVLDIEYI